MASQRHSLLQYVFQHARQGDIKSVIDTIDRFGWTEQWLMNIGDRKGLILDKAVRNRQPNTVLELGTFLGYSSLRMVTQLPPQAHIISIEADKKSAEIARKIHEYAGVSDRITIVNDYTENVIPRLKQMLNINAFHLIFIDHWKDVYLRDLKLLEQYGLIESGTVIVADNVITPGAPDYLNYIRKNGNYTSKLYEATIEYSNDVRDGVEVSVRK